MAGHDDLECAIRRNGFRYGDSDIVPVDSEKRLCESEIKKNVVIDRKFLARNDLIKYSEMNKLNGYMEIGVEKPLTKDPFETMFLPQK